MQPLFTRTSIANIDLGVVCIATARKPDRDKMRKSKIKKNDKKGMRYSRPDSDEGVENSCNACQ